MFIYELMPDINLEDYNNEFKGIIKEGIKYKDDKEKRYEYGWLKELVAFSNTEGGNLYIGVENLTHKIMALSHQEVDKITLMIHRLVKQDITPEISYRIEAIEVQSKENEPRYILLVKVKKNKFTPVFLKQNGINVCYIRHFGKTSIASTNEMVRLCYQNTSFSYDSIFTNTKFDLNNFTKLNSYYNKIKNKDLNVKELISIGFIDEDQNLSNGALMFKDDFKDESLALINCTKYEGINKGGDYFFNNRCFASNLLDEYEKILDFILTNSNQGFKKVVNGRIDVTSYPKRALTEGIINALTHRDYSLTSSQIEINLFKDRLEITSPGSLVAGKWLKNERNLKDIIPIRRNNVICNTFMMLNLMEEKGSGFDKIEEEYQNEDYNHQPFINSDDISLTLTLPNLLIDSGVIETNDFPKINSKVPLFNKNDYKIISYCYFKEHSISEIASMLNVKPSTYLRNIIKNLVNSNLLKVFSSSNNINKYITNKELVSLDY